MTTGEVRAVKDLDRLLEFAGKDTMSLQEMHDAVGSYPSQTVRDWALRTVGDRLPGLVHYRRRFSCLAAMIIYRHGRRLEGEDAELVEDVRNTATTPWQVRAILTAYHFRIGAADNSDVALLEKARDHKDGYPFITNMINELDLDER